MGKVSQLWMDEVEALCDEYASGEMEPGEFRERMERKLMAHTADDLAHVDDIVAALDEDREAHARANPFTTFARVVARAVGWRKPAHSRG